MKRRLELGTIYDIDISSDGLRVAFTGELTAVEFDDSGSIDWLVFFTGDEGAGSTVRLWVAQADLSCIKEA